MTRDQLRAPTNDDVPTVSQERVNRRISVEGKSDSPQGADMTMTMEMPRVTVSAIRDLATVSVPVAAALLGVSPNHLYSEIKAGRVDALTLGRRVLVPVNKLLRLIGADGGDQ